jgi:hypothetical protein
MIWLLTHLLPLSYRKVVSLSQSYYVSPVELTDVSGGRGGANHTTARKPDPLSFIQYSLLRPSLPSARIGKHIHLLHRKKKV